VDIYHEDFPTTTTTTTHHHHHHQQRQRGISGEGFGLLLGNAGGDLGRRLDGFAALLLRLLRELLFVAAVAVGRK
jgi:hypothetical protein